MKKKFYLMSLFGIILTQASCEKGNGGDLPPYAIEFYIVNKGTGVNLVGQTNEHPFDPAEVKIFEMIDGDLSTKRNYKGRYSVGQKEEIGFFYLLDYLYFPHVDYIIYVDELEPDTLTIKNLGNDSFKSYINGVLIEQSRFDQYRVNIPIYKIEKKL